MNPFLDLLDVPVTPAQGKVGGSAYFDNARSMQIGAGNTGYRVMAGKGIWLGAKAFEDAPFSVDMNGNIVATTLSLSAYLKKGDTGQTLSGNILVGAGNVKIDGVNKNIIINDGSNDIILIGYQSGGF